MAFYGEGDCSWTFQHSSLPMCELEATAPGVQDSKNEGRDMQKDSQGECVSRCVQYCK